MIGDFAGMVAHLGRFVGDLRELVGHLIDDWGLCENGCTLRKICWRLVGVRCTFYGVSWALILIQKKKPFSVKRLFFSD